MTSPLTETSHPPEGASDVLRGVEALYDEGRYHGALARGEALGELRAWPLGDGRILASRLARRLGAPRLAQALVVASYRATPEHPEAAYYYAFTIFSRRGAWHGLRTIRAVRAKLREDHGPLLALEAHALAVLRDFEAAHRTLAQAARLEPGSAWIEVERSGVLELEDRMDDALESTAAALSSTPGYRPALHGRAHLMAGLGRREEAIETLTVPHADESWELLSHRAELHHSVGAMDRCEEDLGRAREAALLAEKRVVRHLAERQAEAAYLRGHHRRAEAFAREVPTPFCKKLADALAELPDPSPPPRVELAKVPHVRQHHETCAPASLASIAAFHGDEVDQAEVADAICYAGTPAHRQRSWAEDRGYVVRELDVTFEAARALADAGLPFVLTTSGSATAHAQVVIGYDLARRGLLVRDPSVAGLVELNVDSLLEHQSWHGPHGLVFAPKDREAELDALDLPAVEGWDRQHEVALALEAHDLDGARRACDALWEQAPDSRHAWTARYAIATYRNDVDASLECLDGLLALAPKCAAWILRRGELMRGRAPRAEQLAFWEGHAHLDDVPLLEAYAEELRLETERRDDAARLIGRALRLAPMSGMAHHILADLLASIDRDPLEILESYRFAVCLATPNEHFARAYFDHARLVGRHEEALSMLEARVAKAGDRATGPARTLFDALLDQGNPERGLEILERLAGERPKDGELALILVHACIEAADLPRAAQWLERSRPLPAREDARAIAAARLLRIEGRLEDAREELARAMELSSSHHELTISLFDLVTELDGPDAGLAFLEDAAAREGDGRSLLPELCAQLRGRDAERALALLEARVEEHPEDLWARREIALVLASLGRMDEALASARETARVTPYDTFSHSILGYLLTESGDHDQAREELRRAVSLEPDNADAIRNLGRNTAELETARDDARFVLDRLEACVSRGAGLLEAAKLTRVLPKKERTERLSRLLERSPYRPDAWEAVARAQLDEGELEEADAITARAIERFPRWLSLRLLHADVHAFRADFEAEEEALEELVEMAPHWTVPRVALSELLRARGAIDDAIERIDDGLRRAPKVMALRLERATLGWAAGERDAAFESMLGALADAFGDERAFDRTLSWARELGRIDAMEALVREKIEAHERWSLPHFRLARVITDSARLDERVEALHAALARSPRHQQAADLLAEILTAAGRYDEALAACPPPEWRGPVPIPIHGRRAWVLARRGRVDHAIADMEKTLKKDPRYSWGRQQLCDWLDSAGRAVDFLEHARLLVDGAPTLALNHVYLGDALAQNDEPAEAARAFERAVELDPGNGYSASRAVELLLAEGELERARSALERVRHSIAPGEAEALAVRICAAEGEWEDANEALDRMLEHPLAQISIEAALGAVATGPLADEAYARVEEELARPDPPTGRALGFAWANVRDRNRRWGALGALTPGSRLGPAGRAAAARWIELLANRKAWVQLAWWWLRQRAWLRETIDTWGSFGYALLALRFHRACARWLAGYEGRAGLLPWMLLNLVTSLSVLGRTAETRRAVEHALTLPRDATSDRHRVWHAFHRALDGEPEAALQEALGIPGMETDLETGLVLLLRALAAGARVDGAAPVSELVAQSAPALREAAAFARRERDLVGAYDLAVDTLLASRHPIVRWWTKHVTLPHPNA